MELLDPVERVRDEKITDLVATVIEDQRAPVLVLATARICMFVDRLAGKARQCEIVTRKMGRHPVEQHAYPVTMALVDKIAEVIRCTVTCRRCIVAADLVTP